MSATAKNKIYTQEEYLVLERAATTKSEFYKGEIFAMSGASRNHNVITVNFVSLLNGRLKSKGCVPFSNDMRVHIPLNSLYTYPDVVVVCGKEEYLDKEFDTLLNPVFIVEVLSPSTADYDIGKKFMLYRSIASLREYWVMSSHEYRLQKFVKNMNDNTWILSETIDVNDVEPITCLKEKISLKEIYDGVEF